MLKTTDHERQTIVDYVASRVPDQPVDLIQKVYSEQLHGLTHDIWDVHSDKERWWVITEPTNLYLQAQFPNMDLALTFHIGLCLRVPRSDRPTLADLHVEPLLGCWRAFQQAQDALGTAQELEDYQAIGVRCRECLLSLTRSVQDVIQPPSGGSALKRSDFLGWSDTIAQVTLSGSSQQPRRALLRASAKAAWDFVNWLTHSRSAHLNDAEAALSTTEQLLSLYTTACVRHLRGVPESCPACGSQRLAPERGFHTSEPETTYERPVCSSCNWTGTPVEVAATPAPAGRHQPESDCVIVEVPLRGTSPPTPTDHEE